MRDGSVLELIEAHDSKVEEICPIEMQEIRDTLEECRFLIHMIQLES